MSFSPSCRTLSSFIPLFFILSLFCFHAELKADTIKMMQYNLMYYTHSTPSGCDGSDTYLNNKDINLKKIIQYVEPDLLCVNEIGTQQDYVDRLLNNVLNSDGITYYASTPLTNSSGGSIANMLYYDKRKFVLYHYEHITTSYRDINFNTLYYKSNELAQGDTVFITFIQAHLKAGSSSTDESSRNQQISRLMAKLEQSGRARNYVFAGDFNLYKATEPAYQQLLYYSNSLFRFHDPIDQEGEWNNESSYAAIHTQSTHTYAGTGECFASGGLDDRFDFILVSPYVYYGSLGVQSIASSYHAVGQDGQHFNRSVISPTNNDVPSEIANALYNMSDHLPVTMSLKINATPLSVKTALPFQTTITNPVRDNMLSISIQSPAYDKLTFEIFSLEGKRLDVFSKEIASGYNNFSLPFPFPPAFYLLSITDRQGNREVKKIVSGF